MSCYLLLLYLSYMPLLLLPRPLPLAGDFWHTRGTLPVEPLNEVVQQLAAWRQPTLMLPGNHDQVGRRVACFLATSAVEKRDKVATAAVAAGRLERFACLSCCFSPQPSASPFHLLYQTAAAHFISFQVSLGGEVHALTPLAAANPAIHAFDGGAREGRGGGSGRGTCLRVNRVSNQCSTPWFTRKLWMAGIPPCSTSSHVAPIQALRCFWMPSGCPTAGTPLRWRPLWRQPLMVQRRCEPCLPMQTS